jgi:hypothetical protein
MRAGGAKVPVEEGAENQGSDGDDAADATAVDAGTDSKLELGKGRRGAASWKELAVAFCAPAGIVGGGRVVQHEQMHGANSTTRTGPQVQQQRLWCN